MEMQAQASFIDDRVKQAVASSQATLLDKIDGLISSKFSTFETRISDAQKELSESQLAKIQQNILANDSYTFKRKSCEDQYKFNSKVATKLRDAEANMTNLKDVPDAVKNISEGIHLKSSISEALKTAGVREEGFSRENVWTHDIC